MIAGNHDFLQTNTSRPCALSAILSGRKPSNFFYLQRTGAYRFHNLIFYVKSLTDNETSSTELNIPMLISKIKTEVDDSHCLTHIGLYHGSIAGWRNSIGFVSNTGDSTLESFNELDLLCLGDIHTFQMLKEKKPLTLYSSSLISQNFSEVDDYHGFIFYDFSPDRENIHFQYEKIPNQYRFQEVVLLDQKSPTDPLILVTDGVEFEGGDLQILRSIGKKLIAEQGKIKFSGNTNLIQSRECCRMLEREFPKATFYFDVQKGLQNVQQHAQLKDLDKTQCDDNNTLEPFSSSAENDDCYLINQYLKINQLDKTDLYDEITDILNQSNGGHSVFTSEQSRYKWKILEIKWDNLFSYGLNNILDFEKSSNFKKNSEHYKTLLLLGKNGYGKSSLIDIITLLLFDKVTRFVHGQTLPSEIINFGEDHASGSIVFQVGKDIFKISKNFKRNKKSDKISLQTRFFKNEIEDLTDEDRKKTNQRVQSLIGSYEDFLMFNCSLQEKDVNFLDMSSAKRKSYLNSLFNLTIFEDQEKKHKEKLKTFEIKYNLCEDSLKNKLSSAEYELEKKTLQLRYENIKNCQILQLKKKKKVYKTILMNYTVL